MRAIYINAIAASILLFAACQPAQNERIVQTSAPSIYGDDDRQDVYEYPDTDFAETIREAVVAVVLKEHVVFNEDGTVSLVAPTLQEQLNKDYNKDTDGPDLELCEGERYAEQPTASYCSGTLIDDQLVVTAGHCFEKHECKDFYYVFNYYYKEDGVLETIMSSDVYTCNRLVAYAYNRSPVDFAVVELDRATTGRTPANVQKNNTSLSINDDLISAGFPTGLPAKIDDGGTVKRTTEYWFQATTDTFHGSSGSGIYNSQGTLVGILRSGSGDYRTTTDNCFMTQRYSEDAFNNEMVSYANHALEVLCTKNIETTLCQSECGNAVCDGQETHESCPEDCGVGDDQYRGWLCPLNNYNADDGCHCSCGIPDPDCQKENQRVIGCGSLLPQFCGADGNCHLEQSPDSPVTELP